MRFPWRRISRRESAPDRVCRRENSTGVRRTLDFPLDERGTRRAAVSWSVRARPGLAALVVIRWWCFWERLPLLDSRGRSVSIPVFALLLITSRTCHYNRAFIMRIESAMDVGGYWTIEGNRGTSSRLTLKAKRVELMSRCICDRRMSPFSCD